MMWVLSWNDRSIWLRPGSKHLFGRATTKPEGVERHHYISDKSVSRKHLWFIVGDASDSTDPCSKSSITIVGEGKTGTWLDEQRLPADDQTRTLSGTKHSFRLGGSDTTLVLEWRPILIGFTAGVSRTAKANGTALSAERATFAGCDIKLAPDYVAHHTTHTIAKKRNTGAVLHALVQGSWVVTVSFVEALAAACKQDGKDQDGIPRPSLLEQDFTRHWPREEDYICPSSTEPVARDDSWLKPDTARAELFRDYMFVFMDRSQHSTLTPVINAAGGKTFCCEFQAGETSIESVVDYVKELAGKKDALGLSLSGEPGPGGIVTVRVKDVEKLRDFHVELDSILDQRSIEQTELLDIVLSKDTSLLRQQPQSPPMGVSGAARPGSASDWPVTSSIPAPSGISAMPQTAPVAEEVAQPTRSMEPAQECTTQQAEDVLAPPPAKKRRRFVTQKIRFDDFDPSAIVHIASKSPEPSIPQPSHSQVPGAQGSNVDATRLHFPTSVPQKRSAPAVEDEPVRETAEQRHERMFPGQAALKRRKTEEANKAAASRPETTPAPEVPIRKDEPKAGKTEGKAKRGKKEVDNLRAKMLAKREAQEEEHRLDEEDLRKGIKEEELPTFGNPDEYPDRFPKFDLPVREWQPSITVSENPTWAGRPNYKKFKKQKPNGQENIVEASGDDPRRHIIVLEDRSSRNSGLGEEYWLEHGDVNPRKVKQNSDQSKSRTDSQARNAQGRNGTSLVGTSASHGEGSARAVDDEDERTVFRRRLQSSREMDEDEARSNKMFDAPQGSESTSKSTSQSTLGTETQKKAAGKRPATTGLAAPATKKARQTITTSYSSRTATPAAAELSEDDDPRAFRRRRR